MKFFIFLALSSALPAFAAEESMKQMPILNPKQTAIIKTDSEGEALLEDRGFGDKEQEVKMMNLMMVEGSGYEGMDMAGGMKVAENEQGHSTHSTTATTHEDSSTFEIKQINSKPPKTGANLLEFSVVDRKNGKSAKGLKIKSEVKMTSMDMGTENPPVKETSPGLYKVKAVFSMQGPWAVKLTLPNGEQQTFDFNASK